MYSLRPYLGSFSNDFSDDLETSQLEIHLKGDAAAEHGDTVDAMACRELAFSEERLADEASTESAPPPD
jgi:hypothetical protein